MLALFWARPRSLSTLGVLHHGVPVMWYGHIRDLSPTAEGCMGGLLPSVTTLRWAQQEQRPGGKWWLGDWWVGWAGSAPPVISHPDAYHTQHLVIFCFCFFLSLYFLQCVMVSCRHGICVDEPSAHLVWRKPCKSMSKRTWPILTSGKFTSLQTRSS